ncbi:MAG: serine/threonine protein kinase [Phycisphaerales bacterium]|nr:serine/threonine protein kinase [Phycisphaerales bacterium]
MPGEREGDYGPTEGWDAPGGGVRTGGSSGVPGDSGFFYMGRETDDEPDTIGAYRILETLGEGGFGIVYLALQSEPVLRQVALKVVKPGMDSREVLARFAIERQALAMMTHACIARIFDAGVTDRGRPYFAMEYVKGVPITTYCDSNQLSLRRRLELFAQVCDGVHHAHQKGIIHRDLKPANILVSDEDGEPRPRIIDFGVAKALTQPMAVEGAHTRRQQLIGTLEYMSPEQAGDSADDVDVRADVYALGVVLYQLLTGVLPFDNGEWRSASLPEIQEIIRSKEPPSPSRRLTTLGDRAAAVARQRATRIDTLSRELRRDLQQIPQMAMRKDRTRRYQSAAAMADDIRAYLAGRPLKAHPESISYLAGKFVRRHRVGVSTGALLTLVLVAATTISVSFGIQAQHKSASADQKASGMSEIVDAFADSVVAGEGSLRDRLLQVAEKTLPRLADNPEAEADIRLRIGRTLYQLGDLDNSEAMLLRARSLYEDLYGVNDLHTVESEIRLGHLRYRQGRLADAMACFDAAERMLDGAAGTSTVNPGALALGRAMILRKQGELGEAARLLEAADRHFRNFNVTVDVIETLKERAAIAMERGQPEEARVLLKQCLDLMQEVGTTDSAQVGEVYNRMAGAEREAGRIDEAIVAGERAIEAHRTLDSLSPRLARTLIYHVQTLMKRANRAAGEGDDAAAGRDRQAAQRLMEEALHIYVLRYGVEHEYVAGALITLGQLQSDLGDHDGARDTLERSLAVYGLNPETPEWTIAAVRTTYGKVLATAGKDAEAEAQLLEAWRMLEATEMTSRKSRVAAALADFYAARGRTAEATTWRTRAK